MCYKGKTYMQYTKVCYKGKTCMNQTKTHRGVPTNEFSSRFCANFWLDSVGSC